LATVSTLCPAIALLGAKRPQDRGWQFVVVTLWIVLALPLVQQWVFSPSRHGELPATWRWFLGLLVAISVLNYLPTRNALPAAAVGAGQIVLLGQHGPLPWTMPASIRLPTALALFAGAALAVTWGRRRRTADDGWNRVWLDFRDAFGAVWALRVMERINQMGTLDRLHGPLGWHGFQRASKLPPANVSSESCATSGPLPSDSARSTFETGVRTSLRRFVSNAWIDERLFGSSPADPAAEAAAATPAAAGTEHDSEVA
jgi:hypothetical protein